MLSPFTWYSNYYSTVNNEGRVGSFVSITNGRTDGQTDRQTGGTTLFFKYPRHTDSNGI